MCGLLHDIGRLALFVKLPQAMAPLLEQAEGGEALRTLEFEAFGFDHGDVGGALLQAWQLPDALVCPIRHHHCPDEEQVFHQEARVLELADRLAHAGDEVYEGPSLELDADIVEALRVRAADQVEQAIAELAGS